MDIVTRKQVNILIQLAKADKRLCPEEKKLIHKIAEDKNFPKKEVSKLMNNPEPIDSLGALSLRQKMDYLINCVELMIVDHEVYQSELLFCQSIAVKLGFKKDAVAYLKDNVEFTSRMELEDTLQKRFL